MSELVNTTERRTYSRRGVTIDCRITFADLSAYPKIGHCYRRVLGAFLEWLEGDRLQVLSEDASSDRVKSRRSRLHQIPEQWHFSLTAQLADERYLSICLAINRSGTELEKQIVERRVWDVREGVLCPLARFLPRMKARKYEKWVYSLEKDGLSVYRNDKMYKIDNMNLLKM